MNSVATKKQVSWVATVLTACGIETLYYYSQLLQIDRLQQRLPLGVLKPTIVTIKDILVCIVATALTAYGIETSYRTRSPIWSPQLVATALTTYSIIN